MTSFTDQADVTIVGAGIMGLAQAWAAARRGHRVIVLEQHAKCVGASIRNFGMIWPVGQPPGARFTLAMKSRRLWIELAEASGISLRRCGSFFAAVDADEAEVMQQFAASADDHGYRAAYVDARTAGQLSPLIRTEAVIGGLHSETEMNVDPRQALPALADHLIQSYGVRIHWNCSVSRIEGEQTLACDGRVFRAPQSIVCQGDVAAHLFPGAIGEVAPMSCKLQMLRSDSLGVDMGAMLATGLTLRHYPSFGPCNGLRAYSRRIAADNPLLDQWGIHVMISQDSAGRLVLGDSHQYGSEADPFRAEAIDELILAELNRRFRLPTPCVSQRWQGRYLKRPGHAVLIADPAPGVRIVNGLGGNGMTLSLGIAERMWRQWNDPVLLSGLPDPPAAEPNRNPANALVNG